MKIDLLAHHPQHLQQVAAWCAAEWPQYYGGGDLKVAEQLHGRTLRTDRVPIGLVALDGTRPIGCVTLLEDDMDIRPIYTPWLASLYVDPQYRGQGVGRELIDAAIGVAASIGVPCLFVWSELLGPSLMKRGWQVLERVTFHGKQVSILCCCPRKVCAQRGDKQLPNAAA